jgi:hypothetical protein
VGEASSQRQILRFSQPLRSLRPCCENRIGRVLRRGSEHNKATRPDPEKLPLCGLRGLVVKNQIRGKTFDNSLSLLVEEIRFRWVHHLRGLL